MIDAGTLIKEADRLFNDEERKNAEHTWAQLTEYFLPSQHGLFNTDGHNTPGTRRDLRRYDSTAVQAVFDLAAAINDTLTNRAVQWSKFRFRDSALNENDAAKEWLEDTNNRLHRALDRSNFYSEIAKSYQNLVCLANMSLLIESQGVNANGNFKGIKCTSLHLAQIAFLENDHGRVDYMVRRFKMNLKQIQEHWPDFKDEDIERDAAKNPSKKYEIYHCIKPRRKGEYKVNEDGLSPSPEKRPIASIYVLKKNQHLLEEGGFYEFPAPTTRWTIMPTEVYGTGPAHNALADVRTLNKYVELDLKARALAAQPPLLTTQRNAIGNLNLRPGQVSYLRDVNQVKEYQTQARFDINIQGIQDLRQRVRSMFLLDKLLLPPREEIGEMTAFETAKRVQEMQRILGPTFSRLNDELLTPIVARVYNIMSRENGFKPKPQVLLDAMQRGGGRLEIEYINPLARAQKAEELLAIQQFMQNLGAAAQLGLEEALDNINIDAAAKIAARQLGVPEKVIEDEERIAEKRQARQEQIQQQMQMEQAKTAADVQAKAAAAERGNT